MIRALLLSVALVTLTAGSVAAQTRKHDCDYCHTPHGAGYSQLAQRDVAVNLCQWCHDPDAPIGVDEIDGKVIPRKGRNQADTTGFSNHISGTVGITCRDCHDHEGESVLANGDTNLVLIPAQIATPNSGKLSVAFTNWSLDTAFADTIVGTELGTSYRVCEVCHTLTSRFKNTDTGLPAVAERKSHSNRGDCTECHTHDTGFEGAGSCSTCHSSVQDKDEGTPGSRRAVLAEFSRTSHHANAVQDSDCEVCHDQTLHGASHADTVGRVRLKNADNPSIVYELSRYADPSTNSTEAAKLTAFCLSCHDSDAAGGTVPFSDGLDPPVIDATAWSSSSHGSLTVGNKSCFGDGAFGCHATAHGSERTPLIGLDPDLSPVNGADPVYYQEEGLCFNCHDADGPSTINMKGGFSTAPLWATAPTEYGPANQNDRHDVLHATQQTSGVKIECVNCHNPHADAGTWPVKADPDPSDGRTPGAGWFAADARNTDTLSADFITEWCLDCHDGSYPTGVTDPTDQVVNILDGVSIRLDRKGACCDTASVSTYFENSHGAGPSGASLKTGTNYWALDAVVSCMACHQAHPDSTPQQVTGTLFNNFFLMKDTIFGTDWSTVIPSDGGSYELTTLDVRNSNGTNSYFLCNTCHTGSMGSGKENCSDCHVHGDNRF